MNRTCLLAFEALNKRRPHDGRICQSKFGRDLNDSRTWFELAVEDAGIRNLRWHDLRHHADILVMPTCNSESIQVALEADWESA
jgi:hypothetical protein